MASWLHGIIDRLFVVAGALVFSQAPLFMQQYTHQLNGHASELQYQVKQLEAAAAEAGKPLPEYIYKFSKSKDADFARQGMMMQAMVDRWLSFNQALTALHESTVFSRPFLFIAFFNMDVARATWTNFEYGLSFNLEGIAFAFVGMTVGYLLFASISWTVKTFMLATFSRRRENPS